LFHGEKRGNLLEISVSSISRVYALIPLLISSGSPCVSPGIVPIYQRDRSKVRNIDKVTSDLLAEKKAVLYIRTGKTFSDIINVGRTHFGRTFSIVLTLLKVELPEGK
jgi:hypothetical protein